MTNSFHKGNENMKSIFVYNTCPDGFKSNGIFCEKLKSYEPDYCESAHIYRKYKNETIKGLNTPSDFNFINSAYLKKNGLNKEKDQEEYKLKVREHIVECDDKHKDKDDLIKSVCLESNDKFTTDMCQRQYCYKNNETFCHLWNDPLSNHNLKTSDGYVKTSLYILILIIILIMIGSRLIN
jgi:hypothetical protein